MLVRLIHHFVASPCIPTYKKLARDIFVLGRARDLWLVEWAHPSGLLVDPAGGSCISCGAPSYKFAARSPSSRINRSPNRSLLYWPGSSIDDLLLPLSCRCPCFDSKALASDESPVRPEYWIPTPFSPVWTRPSYEHLPTARRGSALPLESTPGRRSSESNFLSSRDIEQRTFSFFSSPWPGRSILLESRTWSFILHRLMKRWETFWFLHFASPLAIYD